MEGMVEPEAIDAIRRLGVLTCNFSCNNVHQFDLVERLARHFDYSLHTERCVRDRFLAVGATPLWWPLGSNPTYFRPVDVARSVDVSFVGANYAQRARYVAHLLGAGIDVHVYGPAWPDGSATRARSLGKRYFLAMRALAARGAAEQAAASAALADHDCRRALARQFPLHVHKPVSDDELVRLYSRSRVSLGFLEVYDGHRSGARVLKHLHLREFEAPMCGALLCTGWSDELEEFFVPEQEIVVYRDCDELVDKVRYYLSRPEAGDRIRRAGRDRALREHTSHERFRALFRALRLAEAQVR
jgi:spore maturation protein CgeB